MKNLQRGFVNIYLAIAILVIVGVAGFMMIKSSKPVEMSETANWKTYTVTQYGFEFKYPSDWVFQETDSNSSGSYGMVVRKLPDYNFFVDVVPHSYPKGIESGINDVTKLIVVDGHKALLYGGEEFVVTVPPKQDTISVLIETGPYSFLSYEIVLTMDSNNHNKNMRKIFSSILSTFKFTK